MEQQNVNPRYLPYNSQEVKEILQQVEKLDNAPTEGSEYPVKSGAVKEALDTKQDNIDDLTKIRAGSEAGEAALQFVPNNDPGSLWNDDSSDDSSDEDSSE